MRKKWPILLVIAAIMFWRGHAEYGRAEKLESAHPDSIRISDADFVQAQRERSEAKTARSTGLILQIVAGGAALFSVAMLGYGFLSRRGSIIESSERQD